MLDYSELSLYIWPEPVLAVMTIDGNQTRGSRIITVDSTGSWWRAAYMNVTLIISNGDSLGRDVRVRFRAIEDATHIKVAENDIIWHDNATITVINFYEPWSVAPRVVTSGGIATWYMDYDRVYSNQQQFIAPVVCMGPNLAGPAGSQFFFTATGTWDPTGDSISSYDWTWIGPGIAPYSGVTPGLKTFNTPGNYTVELIVENSHGAWAEGLRHIQIGAPTLDWAMGPLVGGIQEGGYRTTITLFEDAPALSPCSLVTIVSNRDMASGAHPRIFFSGYVVGRSINFNYHHHITTFDVVSLSMLTDKLDVFGSYTDYSGLPTNWTEIYQQTAERAVVCHLRAKTTLLVIADLARLGDTIPVKTIDFPRGGAINPIRDVLRKAIQADLVCNAQGQLVPYYIESLRPVTSRVSSATAERIHDHMWRDQPQVVETTVPDVSFEEVGGTTFSGETGTTTAYMSSYPGNVPGRFGKTDDQWGTIALPTAGGQTLLNELAGHFYEWTVNQYKQIEVPMSRDFRRWDLAPQKLFHFPIDKSFVDLTNSNLVINQLTHTYNPRSKSIVTDASFEKVTLGAQGVTVVIPPIIKPPIVDPPIIKPSPPPPRVIMGDVVVTMTGGHIGISTNCISSVAAGRPEDTTWTEIRPSAFIGSMVMLDISPSGKAWLVTFYSNHTQDGLWYCPDILATPPVWSLIKTNAQVEAETGSVSTYLEAICIDPATDTAYVPVSGLSPYYGQYYYYTSTGGATTFHSQVFNPGPGSGGHYEGTRYACCWDAANSRPLIAASAMGFGVLCAVADMITGTVISSQAALPRPSNTYNVSPNFGMIANAGTGAIAPISNLTEPGYDGSHPSGWPMFEKDGHLFWTKSTTGNLMLDHSIQAIPNDSGPTQGVFSISGATGGGYSCGDTYGTIFWAAHTQHAANSRRDIAMTQNGGLDWLNIGFNWGANIAAYDGGALGTPPVILWRPTIRYEPAI